MQTKSLLRTILAIFLPAIPAASAPLRAQQVQPVIMEYRNKAEGKFSVVNTTLEPMVVVLEPKSFSISPNGRGTFRALDPGIHVQLSTMSVKLQPLESYTIFYKADADAFPAWFTIYATFSPARTVGASISVRVQLPHTVYMYQSKPVDREEIHVINARYSVSSHKLVLDMMNMGKSLTRVQEVRASAPHVDPATVSGFPLLPGALRTVEVAWKGSEPPTSLNIDFEHFTLKPSFAIETDPPVPAPAAQTMAQSGVAPSLPATGK
jgi:hypothetical protein